MPETSERKPLDRKPSYEPLGETVDRIARELESKTGEPEYKTGLEVLDKGIFGLHSSQMTVFAARAGQGKTSWACNAAFNLANSGKKVAFISLEMAKEQILTKMYCAEMNVDGFKFLIGKVSEVEKEKLRQFKKVVEELPLRIIDDYCFTQDELYTLIEHLEFRPQILFIDHLQHIRATDGRRSERENLTEYLRYLKELAMRYKMAVVCLSQINREGDDKPTLKTLKGTGAIEEMADHVILLHIPKKEEAFNSDNSDLKEGCCEVAKNRFGPCGTFPILFNGKIGKFFDQEIYRPQEKVSDWQDRV